MKENAEKHGVQNLYLSDELLATLKKAWLEVAAERSAKDPMFKKLLKISRPLRSLMTIGSLWVPATPAPKGQTIDDHLHYLITLSRIGSPSSIP